MVLVSAIQMQRYPVSRTKCICVQASMKEAVKSAADFLNAAAKVVLVIGSQVKTCGAQKQAVQLADACQYPVAAMPRSKGMFPETHPRCIPLFSMCSW